MKHFLVLVSLVCCNGTPADAGPSSGPDTDGSTDDTDSETTWWKDLGLDSSTSLSGVYTGGTGVWAVGEDGAAWFVQGSNQLSYDTQTSDDLEGLWGSGDQDAVSLVAVGASGTVTSFSTGAFAVTDLGNASFFDVDGGVDELTAVSWAGIFRGSGSTWAEDDVGAGYRFNGVYVGNSLSYAVGEEGVIMKQSGGTWSLMDVPVTENIHAVAGAGDADVWAVGFGGMVLHYDGSEWVPFDSGVVVSLWDVWVAGSGEVYVVGSNGTALIRDADAIAAQEDDELAPAFRPLLTGSDSNLYGVSGSSADNVWAVGSRGAILRYSGEPQ